MLQTYHQPLDLGAEGFITSALSLTLEHSTHVHHLPFYLFPLNRKETKFELISSFKCYKTIEN